MLASQFIQGMVVFTFLRDILLQHVSVRFRQMPKPVNFEELVTHLLQIYINMSKQFMASESDGVVCEASIIPLS